jgi:hypothetical protein
MAFHPLQGAFERVERAAKHLVELEGEIAFFRQVYLHAIGVKFDPDPPYKISPSVSKNFTHPSNLIGIIIGEICYNLRAALDYLVYELAILDSGSVQDRTQFTIEETPKKFRGQINRQLIGLNPVHIAAIERLQPYNGCYWTKLIAEISNPDKHRQITATGTPKMLTLNSGGPRKTVNRPKPTLSYVCRAERPDGREVEVEIVSTVFIMLPIEQNPAWSSIYSAENALHEAKTEVANLLKAFEPEFQISGGHGSTPALATPGT